MTIFPLQNLRSRRRFFSSVLLVLGFWMSGSGVASAEELDLSPYKGKVVYVDFWASWCVPCRASFPWMNDMHRQYADKGLVIVAVNTGDTDADRQRFLERYPAEFEIVVDPDGKIAEQYDLQGMPTSYLIDVDGNEVSCHVGFNESKSAVATKEIIEALKSVKP